MITWTEASTEVIHIILAGETVAKAAQLELPHVREPKAGSVRSLSQEELSRINDSPVEPDPQPEEPAAEPFLDLDPSPIKPMTLEDIAVGDKNDL
ncbi:MAG TPA: hypothetical protein VLH85_01950 [Levilinea sp.]|nr:hypothetical protein [Levilinea sp.]